jgi:hypothetical protein
MDSVVINATISYGDRQIAIPVLADSGATESLVLLPQDALALGLPLPIGQIQSLVVGATFVGLDKYDINVRISIALSDGSLASVEVCPKVLRIPDNEGQAEQQGIDRILGNAYILSE